MPEVKTFFAILGPNQEPRTKHRHISLYKTEKGAIKAATRDGDTVVRLTLNTGEEPVFIRRKLL